MFWIARGMYFHPIYLHVRTPSPIGQDLSLKLHFVSGQAAEFHERAWEASNGYFDNVLASLGFSWTLLLKSNIKCENVGLLVNFSGIKGWNKIISAILELIMAKTMVLI